jgi:hypothetical protein
MDCSVFNFPTDGIRQQINIYLTGKQYCGSGDLGFLSGIPDFYPSRILDQKTGTKIRGMKQILGIPFLIAINFTKLKITLSLKCLRKQFWPVFKEF